MPTDVAPLVINEYTVVVNVASDGEVLTETSLSNMMVAALNRIEHVRQNIPALSTKIPQIVDIHEEFTAPFWDSANNVLHADSTWRTHDSGGATVVNTGGLDGDVGGLNITLSSNNDEFAISWAAVQPTNPSISSDQIDRFACLFRPNSPLGDLTARLGMAQDMLPNSNPEDVGLWGLAFFIEPGDTNWSVRTRTAGGTSVVNTGVAFVQNDIFLFEIVQTSAGNWSCRINETEVASFSDPADDVITDEQLNFGVHVHLGSATSINCDILYLGMRTLDLGQRYD